MDHPEPSPVTTPKPAEKKAFAWQPLTPRGVIRFASASFSRLWLVQLGFALFCAGCVVWSVYCAWVPVISTAISRLPLQSEIRHGRMNWGGSTPDCLAENRFLSLAIDLKHEGQARSPAHLQFELGEKTVKILSLLGFVEVSYPADRWIKLGRADAQPWWDAWRPALLTIMGGGVALSLIICWGILATLYCLPARLAAFLGDRKLDFGGSWRLSGAAVTPGGLFLALAIVLYALGWLDLLLLGLAMVLHFLIAWVYLGLAIFRLPHDEKKTLPKTNPFAANH